MKIDTTATILQLSSLLAASAGVAAPSQAGGTDAGTAAAVSTTQAATNPKPLSFSQLLAQIQQAAADSAKATTVPPATVPAGDVPAPPAKEQADDPASISNALLALMSQSTQPLPANVPVAATPPSTSPADVQPAAAAGVATTQASDGPTAAIGCPPAIVPGTTPDSAPQPVAQSDGKIQPLDFKATTPAPTSDVPTSTPATPAQVTAVSNGKGDPNNLTAMPAASPVDQPPVATGPTPPDKAPVAATTPVSPAESETPIIDTKAVPPKAAEVRIQPADASSVTAGAKESVANVTSDKIGGTAARHARNEIVQAAVSAAGNAEHVDFSNLTSEIGDAVVEASSDAAEPVKKVTDEAKSKESSDTTVIESGMAGETANGVTDVVTSADPASQTAPIDAHNLAHHLEAMAMQRLDQPESSDRASVVLRLDPPELGRVNVHMSVANDVISIRMVTTGDAARQVIEQQLNQLQQSLTDKGISFQDFQIQTGGGSQQQQSSHQGFAKHWADHSGYSAFGGRRGSTAVSTPQIRSGNPNQLNYVA